jgi:hypothetical protein
LIKKKVTGKLKKMQVNERVTKEEQRSCEKKREDQEVIEGSEARQDTRKIGRR